MKNKVFRSQQAHELIDYVASQYGGRLEFLWERFPDNAIWRAPNGKWYGALLRVARYKITGQGEEMVEILDLRYQRDELADFLRHQEHVYPGWHMNKDNWLTVILDDSLETSKIITLLDNSYQIAVTK